MSSYGGGIVFGIAFALLFLGIWYTVRKMRGDDCKEMFEERQLSARSLAYQTGFFTFMGGICIDACLKLAGIAFYHDPLGEFAALFAALIVFAVQAVRHDAFVALNRKWKTQVILYSFITLAQLINTVTAAKEGSLVQDGKLSLQCIGPLCFMTFLIITIMLIIRNLSEKLELQEDL